MTEEQKNILSEIHGIALPILLEKRSMLLKELMKVDMEIDRMGRLFKAFNF